MRATCKHVGGPKASLALVLPLLLVAGRVAAQTQAPFSVSVDVNLVVLHASVHDSRGRDVLNLQQQNFTVYEDGVKQIIRFFLREDTPVTAGLIVDHSSSMGAKLSEVTAAARTFAQSSNRQDEMFVVNFNERVFSGLAGERQFTDSPADLQAAIARAPVDGQTALYDAVAAGLEQLKVGRWDKKVLVLISDGGDNASTHTLAGITRMAEESSAVVYTIGMFTESDPDANPGVLKRLAQATGGEAFFPKEPAEVSAICKHIARDIRSQYTIGYVSINAKHDSAYRSVRVVTESLRPGGKLRVRTRSGYVAQGAAK